MPIPFRLSEEIETLGEAAFLHLEPQSPRDMRGALLFLNALGEPKEFVYNRIRLDSANVLWRPETRPAGAARRLIASLLEAAQGWPRLLFCRADHVEARMFGGGSPGDPEATALIALDVPVARLVRTPLDATVDPENSVLETFDARGEALTLTVDWALPLGPPAEGEAGSPLLALLCVRGLLWEPFERTAVGLNEAYGAASAATAR